MLSDISKSRTPLVRRAKKCTSGLKCSSCNVQPNALQPLMPKPRRAGLGSSEQPRRLRGVCSTGTVVAVRDRLTNGKEVAKTNNVPVTLICCSQGFPARWSFAGCCSLQGRCHHC